MTILGIDYGRRWLGLALGHTETRLAFPYSTLEQGKFLFSRLAGICRCESVEEIIIGLPNIWRTKQTLPGEIKQFGEVLHTALCVPVQFVEEIFTSRIAQGLALKNARHSTHAQAATLILENYFSQSSNFKAQMSNQIQMI